VVVNGAHEGYWIVGNGVKSGERVVVEGTQNVRGGIVVKPTAADKAKS